MLKLQALRARGANGFALEKQEIFRRLRLSSLNGYNSTGRLRKRVKRSPYRLISSSVFRSDNTILDVKQYNKIPPLIDSGLTTVQKITKLVRVLYHGKEQSGNWFTTYNRILDFKKKLDESSQSPGKKVYELRLYDL
ncbi:unnamed protein product, partial [Gongylonema pulchrum]|uniref:Uncharacterized protein n=1 Tax=Gongylonema pulchrum TaxID=637853 RepID=A0A183D6M7_9BILA